MRIPKLKNLYLVFKDQLPLKRLYVNFFVTKNARGLFHKESHVSSVSGLEKVGYGRRVTAEKAAASMQKKNPDLVYKPYKCLWCDKYHIGRNKVNA